MFTMTELDAPELILSAAWAKPNQPFPSPQPTSPWADPSEQSYSREAAAEERRATLLEAMYGR